MSTQVNRDVTDIINRSIQANTMSCSAAAIQRNSIVMKAKEDIILNGITMDSTSKVDLRCVATATNTQTIDNDIKAKIKQYAQTKLDGLNLFQFGASTNVDETVTQITNEVKVSTIQSMVASSLQENSIDLSSEKSIQSLDQIKMTQNADVLNSAILTVVNNSSGVMNLQKTIDQRASTELVGLFTFGSLGLILLALIIWFFLSRKGKGRKGGKAGNAEMAMSKIDPEAFLPYGRGYYY